MATTNEKAQRRISQNLGTKIDVTKLQPSKGHALLKEGHVTNKAIIRSVFRKHNHDDVLNDHELQGILVDLELPKEIFNPETNRALMLLLDKDGSGEVDFEEFFSWWSAMCGDNVDNIDLTIVNLGQLYVGMKSFTENKDGTLDFPNFAALWEYCGNDADAAEDVFDELDTDGGGTITFQELALSFGFYGNKPTFDKEHFGDLFDDPETFREKQLRNYESLLEKQIAKPAPQTIQKFKNRVLEEAKENVEKKKTAPKKDSKEKKEKLKTLRAPRRKKDRETVTFVEPLKDDSSDIKKEVETLRKELEMEKRKSVAFLQSGEEAEKLRQQLEKAQMEFDVERLKLEAKLTTIEDEKPKDNLEEQLKLVTEQRDNARKQFDQMDTERLKLMSENRDMQNIRENLKRKVEELEKSLANAQKETEKVSKERDAALQENGRMKIQLQVAESGSQKGEIFEKEIEELRYKIEKQSKELQENKKTIEKMRKDAVKLATPTKSSSSVVAATSLVGCKWERSNKSKYVFSDDDTTVTSLHDYEESAAIGTFTLGSSGVFSWEFTLEKGCGATYVGVVTKQHPVNKSLRNSPHAWVLRIEGGVLFENGKQLANHYWDDDHKIEEGTKIGVVADMTRGTITFMRNGQDFGVAFQNVPTCVYPAITVYHRGTVSTDFSASF